MKDKMILILIIVFFLIGGIAWYINGLNKIVRMDEKIKESWAEIDNQLKRRNDLIPNLVETVKGYAAHEKEVFKNIAEARAAYAGAGNIDSKIKAEQMMQGALARLLAIIERYPDLKANQSFQKLMDELAGTENRIAVARMRYNRDVKTFNTYIREVIGSFFAKRRALDKPAVYFEVEESEKRPVKVEF